MNIICTNKNCSKEFKLNIVDLNLETSISENHTTQYLATGTIYCPFCKHEMEIEYLFDEVNETGEILSEEVQSLT